MAYTTSKTLEKNMRREGVLDNIELKDLNLKKLPELNNGDMQNTEMQEFKDEIANMCKAISFWTFEGEILKLFDQIDMSNDGLLSLDEVHRWFVRNKLQGCDMNTIRKYRSILKLGIQNIDKNNNGSVNREEFALL